LEGEVMSTIRRRRGVRQRRWSKAEYYRLGELGFFPGERVELIEGRIMVQSPQNAPHWSATERVRARLEQAFGAGFLVRMQGPIDLGQTTEPEPDIAVVTGSLANYTQAHPTTAVLIVEVSDTTLSYDRRRKGNLYARAGVADYWIIDLVHRRLEVYRAPVPAANRPYGHRYSSRTDLTPPAAISPLALPQVVVPVADLLP
jgi:Uma2 family endonuclease